MKFHLGVIPITLLAAAACSDGGDITRPNTSSSATDVADFTAAVGQASGATGAVYLQTNDAAGNAVLMLARDAHGGLAAPVAFSTGGLGTGAGLGNQGALALAGGGRFLYVVNAGSDEVSGFRVGPAGLDLIGTWASGGDLPISLVVSGHRVYVLHDGAETKVVGFAMQPNGVLAPLADADQVLPNAAPDAAQIGATPDGRWLVVTEKAANVIVSVPVHTDGSLGTPVETASSGMTPFGFAFDRRGTLIVSEAVGGSAGASTVSSYRFTASGWEAVTASAGNGQTAVCWVAVSPNGHFAYATNTGSATVSGYRVEVDGSLTALDADGVTATTGTTPIDLGFSRNGRYVYTLNAGSHTITGFRVGGDGSLTAVGSADVPAGVNGMAAQ